MISSYQNIGFLQHRAGDLIKNRYEVLSHLGGGNFGSVYQVRDNAVGNVLACKEMHVLNHPDTPHDERALALELFRREALNLATLRHPHIPSAYFEQEDGEWKICPICGLDFSRQFCPQHGSSLLPVQQRYYLMMDYIEGPTLEELAQRATQKQRVLDEQQCVEWVSQIGSALGSLHKLGIVHRDVKPDNIKIRAHDNAAFLLDFGLTKKAEEAGVYGTVQQTGTGRFGTLGYAPRNPDEQMHPEARSDIYALGMTLYRLLSGRDPQDAEQLAQMHEYSPRHFNTQISPLLERVILGCIHHDKTQRYQSIELLLNELSELRDTAPSYAPPFTFSDGSRARNAVELAHLIETHPEESLPYLWNGMFAAWLRQNGFAAPSRAAADIVRTYGKQPTRALEMFRRTLYPSGGGGAPKLAIEPNMLSFGALPSGESATQKLHIKNIGAGLAWGKISVEPRVLSAASGGTIVLDDAAQSVNPRALPGLVFPAEFDGNDAVLEVKLDTAKVATGAYSGHLQVACGDEKYRVPVNYTVESLHLKLKPSVLEFGSVPMGRRESRTFRVRHDETLSTQNASAQSPSTQRGTPRGVIHIGERLPGLFAPSRFEGEEEIEVIIDTTATQVMAHDYEGGLLLDTNGGRLRLPVRYTVSLPPARWISMIASATGIGFLIGFFVRLFYVVVDARYVVNWLVKDGVFANFSSTDFRAPVLAGMTIGVGVAAWLIPKIIEEKQRQLPASQVVMQTLPLSGLLGASLCWPLIFVMHWIIWLPFDWVLLNPATLLGRLFLQGKTPAPIVAWAIAGTLCGAIWGIARVLAARGSTGARYVALGIYVTAFFALLFWAMVTG